MNFTFTIKSLCELLSIFMLINQAFPLKLQLVSVTGAYAWFFLPIKYYVLVIELIMYQEAYFDLFHTLEHVDVFVQFKLLCVVWLNWFSCICAVVFSVHLSDYKVFLFAFKL
jgi:hypothetical protein